MATDYHLRSNFFLKNTATAFMVTRNASKTMMAADVLSRNARSGLSAHKKSAPAIPWMDR